MRNQTAFVSVAVAAPLDKPLAYAAPPELRERCLPGHRVLAPLGKRRVTGYVLGPCPPPEGFTVKSILEAPDQDPLFPPEMLPFFEWCASYYFHPLGQVIQDALPTGVNTTESAVAALTDLGRVALTGPGLKELERAALARLVQGPAALKTLLELPGVTRARLSALEKKGFLSLERQIKQGKTRPKLVRFVRARNLGEIPKKRSAARDRILHLLSIHGELPFAELKSLVSSAPASVRALVKEGRVEILEKAVFRDPLGEEITPDDPSAIRLNQEQESALARILGTMDKGFSTLLLEGVTGSGKTEVYLRAVRAVLDKGGNAIVLVPEIALVSQIERRFRARFGDTVALLHSGLGDSERHGQWMRILKGEARVALGARSAVFAPFASAALIIVDEEHDDSYKQESHLRYNARDLAVVRARMCGAVALLGSATPSLQSAHNALTGKYGRLVLSKRVMERPRPEVRVVDLARLPKEDRKGPFISRVLADAVTETLARREQVLLFLNRRGYANLPMCGACGSPVACENCAVTLTAHRKAGVYQCHYCGLERDVSLGCPECGSMDIRAVGVGTEKIEGFVKRTWPDARVARMDRDTTARRSELVAMLKALREGKTDVLIGTQMVSKGHDFPNITLVGILCADLSLGFPDFRAAERTFQILAQVAGRAGRGDRPGKVVLQTFNPAHFCVTTARDQDYSAFFDRELALRQELGYPPFSRLAQVRVSSAEEDLAREHAKTVGDWLRAAHASRADFVQAIKVLGPVASPIPRVAGQYRWQMLIKGFHYSVFREFLTVFSQALKGELKRTGAGTLLDVDPHSML